MENKQRLLYLDILRIIGAFAVVTLHMIDNGYDLLKPNTTNWIIFDIYYVLAKFAVPIFVMISGALFLSKKTINIKKLYKKNIFRLAASFFIWSTIYAIFSYIIKGEKNIIENIFTGEYHMWFIPMIIGLYMISPLLKKITDDRKTLVYFLKISFIVNCILLIFSNIPYFKDINLFIANIDLNLVVGYSLYFAIGYYIFSKNDMKKQIIKSIYILTIISIIINIIITIIIPTFTNQPYKINNFLPTVFMQSIGIFVLIKNLKINFKEKTQKTITKIAEYSYGIYLSHILVKGFLVKIMFNPMDVMPIITIPLMIMLDFILSLIITCIIKKIPIAKKYAA